MSEYVYMTNGKPLMNESGELSLARAQIVRCKNCRWIPDQSDRESGDYYHCNMWNADVGANGFCSYGIPQEANLTFIWDTRTGGHVSYSG